MSYRPPNKEQQAELIRLWGELSDLEETDKSLLAEKEALRQNYARAQHENMKRGIRVVINELESTFEAEIQYHKSQIDQHQAAIVRLETHVQSIQKFERDLPAINDQLQRNQERREVINRACARITQSEAASAVDEEVSVAETPRAEPQGQASVPGPSHSKVEIIDLSSDGQESPEPTSPESSGVSQAPNNGDPINRAFSMVRWYNGKWCEFVCPGCKANAAYNAQPGQFMKELKQHFTKLHATGTRSTDWTDAQLQDFYKRCVVREFDEDDVKRMGEGKAPAGGITQVRAERTPQHVPKKAASGGGTQRSAGDGAPVGHSTGTEQSPAMTKKGKERVIMDSHMTQSPSPGPRSEERLPPISSMKDYMAVSKGSNLAKSRSTLDSNRPTQSGNSARPPVNPGYGSFVHPQSSFGSSTSSTPGHPGLKPMSQPSRLAGPPIPTQGFSRTPMKASVQRTANTPPYNAAPNNMPFKPLPLTQSPPFSLPQQMFPSLNQTPNQLQKQTPTSTGIEQAGSPPAQPTIQPTPPSATSGKRQRTSPEDWTRKVYKQIEVAGHEGVEKARNEDAAKANERGGKN